MPSDLVASFIINANHSVMRAATELRVVNGIACRIWPAIPQPTEWERVGNQIDAAMIFARAHFVSVL